MKHPNNFDFLRFFFAFLVVIGHTIILSGRPEFQNDFLAKMPVYSVLGFFIISGYLVYPSYERLKNIKKYFFNRAIRILPAYLFVIIFFAFFLFFFSGVGLKEYFSTQWLKYTGVNLIFLNFLEPCINFLFNDNLICAVNGSLWTIKIELMFYISVPFLYYFIKNKSILQRNLILIMLYALSSIYFLMMINLGKDILARQFPGALNYFTIGILLNLNKEFFKKYIYYLLPIAVLIIYLEKGVFGLNILTPIAFGISIFWFAFLKIPLKNFGKYGDFSYGIYLVHFPIVQLFVQLKIYEKYSYLGFAASTLLVLISAVLIWKLVENPILRRKFIRISPE